MPPDPSNTATIAMHVSPRACAGDALALRHDLLSSGALKCSTQPYCRCLAGDMLIVAPVMHYMSLKCDSVSCERTCTATSLLSTNSSLLAAGATKYPAD